jgi:hypothetical protein
MRDKPTSKKENLFAASRFVLPEHRELYLRIKAEEARYIPPTLDDEQRAELSEQVWQAFRDKCSVTVTFFDGRMMQRHAGIIAHLDQAAGRLKFRSLDRVDWLPFEALYAVERS